MQHKTIVNFVFLLLLGITQAYTMEPEELTIMVYCQPHKKNLIYLQAEDTAPNTQSINTQIKRTIVPKNKYAFYSIVDENNDKHVFGKINNDSCIHRILTKGTKIVRTHGIPFLPSVNFNKKPNIVYDFLCLCFKKADADRKARLDKSN